MSLIAELKQMHGHFQGQPPSIRFLWLVFCFFAVVQSGVLLIRTALLILKIL